MKKLLPFLRLPKTNNANLNFSLKESSAQGGKFMLLLFSFFAVLSGTKVFAATVTANTSGNYSTASIWSTGTVPLSTDDIIISNNITLTVDGDRTCNSIGFTSPTNGAGSGTLIVNTGVQLTVTNDLSIPAASLSVKVNGAYNISGLGTISCGKVDVGNNNLPGGNSGTTIKLTSTISTLNISGNLVLNSTFTSGGNKVNNPTFNLQSGTVTVNGSVTSTNANALNVSALDMVTSASNPTLILAGATPFSLSALGTNTITLNGTGATVSYTNASAQTVYPTTYTNLTLSGGGNKTTTGVTINGTLSLQGTAAAVTTAPTYGPAATLEYKGSGAQTTTNIEFPVASGPNSLTINNTNGVTLNSSKTVNGTLTLTSGNLNIGASNLTLGAAAPAVAGGPFSATKMIIASGGGSVVKSGNSAASASYTFPVGDNTGTAEFSPITLNFTSGTYTSGSASVSVTNAKHPNNTNATNFLSRYWTVGTSGYTVGGATVTANYVDADIVGTEANILLGKWTGSLPFVSYASSINTATNTLTSPSITTFGDFTGVTNVPPTVSIAFTQGAATACQNSTVSLQANATGDPTLTYLWSTGATTSSITAPTSVLGTINYTVTVTDGNGFTANASQGVTVVASPVTRTVTGGGNYCSGGTGVAIGLNASSSGTTYQLFNGATPVGSPVSGTGSAISFGNQTAAGTYTVVATLTSTGCTSNMSGSATIVVDASAVTRTVTGGGNYCSGGTGVAIGLDASSSGTTYQLFNGATPVGSPVSGTGSAISFGNQTAAGTYTVIATLTSTGCTSNMSGSATVAVNASPVTYTVTGGGSYCSGGTGVAIGLNASSSGTTYQLFNGATPVGSPVSGTGSAISFGNQTAVGTYIVAATLTSTGCTSNMSGSVIINPLPVIRTVTGGGSYCSGGTGVAIGLNASSSGTSYQLFNGVTSVGNSVNGTGSAISFGNQTAAGTYTAVATIISTGCTIDMTGSATVTVNPSPDARMDKRYPVSQCGNGADGLIIIDTAGAGGTQPFVINLFGNSPNPTPNFVFNNLAQGTYRIIVTDANGCLGFDSSIVIGLASPMVVTATYISKPSSCGRSDGAFTAHVAGGIERILYSISINGGTPTPYQQNPRFTGLPAGVPIIITGKDFRNGGMLPGCTASSGPITLTAASPIIVGTNNVIGESACNTSDGSINANAGNGFAPYTYSLAGTVNRPLQSSNIFSGLPAGTYTVTAQDAKICTGTSSTITISKNTTLTATIYTKKISSCLGGTDGSITARALGGASPFMYSLTGGAISRPYQTSNLFTNLPAGTYTLGVKDVRGCTATTTVPLADGTGSLCGGIANNSVSLTIDKSTSNSTEIKVNVYPNPSKTEFTVMLESRSNAPIELKVVSADGKTVHQYRGSATQQYRFGAHFASGMYLLQITQGKATRTVKLIKGN